ncbi:MAG: hypothetical protein LAP85_25500 [Acidobacteriia bacterium]|nr:hypothetical protein [Terriglobia bacterium]
MQITEWVNSHGSSGRDDRGRLFTPLVPEALELLFERLGFQRIGKWEIPDRRPGYSWTTLLFDLRSDQQLRPIDQIEGVLNRDRKVATYKLACSGPCTNPVTVPSFLYRRSITFLSRFDSPY